MAEAAHRNEGPWSDDEAEHMGESRSGDDDASRTTPRLIFNDDVPHVDDSSQDTAALDPPSPARSEQNAEAHDATSLDTVIESWLARLRPSPSDLAAGAAAIASPELYEHRRMLLYVGERSASKMLGEKMGAPPGKDPSTDEAWRYLVDHARYGSLANLIELLSRDAPTERKADVMRFLAMLITEQGMRFLRAFAHELWVHAGSPCATAMGEPTAVTTVNWSACWAWCVAPSPLDDGERARARARAMLKDAYTHSCPAQGHTHRGHALQRRLLGWPLAARSRQAVDPRREIAKAAHDLPHRFGERLPRGNRLQHMVQHPSMHALVWICGLEQLDAGPEDQTGARHVPRLPNPDPIYDRDDSTTRVSAPRKRDDTLTHPNVCLDSQIASAWRVENRRSAL
jgi:hypothetical protein